MATSYSLQLQFVDAARMGYRVALDAVLAKLALPIATPLPQSHLVANIVGQKLVREIGRKILGNEAI
jgi:hypothetical protein